MELIKEFVPYDEALALKELGFNEPCFATYNGEVLELSLQIPSDDYFTQAPLYQQAFRFLREKFGLKHSIQDFIDDELGIEWDYSISIIGTDADEKGNYYPLVDYSIDDETRKFKTHEEAELACLRKIIQIAKGQ